MTATNGPDYDARIDRAKQLASEYPYAAEVLGFYQRLATLQKAIYFEMRKAANGQSGSGQGDLRDFELNHAFLREQFPRVLSFLESVGPAPIAEAARRLASQEVSAWANSLSHFWRVAGRRRQLAEEADDESADALRAFVLRAFLQPQVEFLAQGQPPPPADGRPRHCPRCESVPLIGVLHPEGDGARRSLICSFCLGEWEFRRILCPACGEGTEKKLPVYVAEQFPHVRIEACDTCRSYLRTIDLSKNGHAVPIVDDLAAIPLSLWAEERGYKRIQPNLLGT